MRFLLDTHAFLWFILDDLKLSSQADCLISNSNNEVVISPASYWEIAIKISMGKYSLPEPYAVFMEREIALNNFLILPIEPKHTALLTILPFYHKDPFDRLLVAQALVEDLSVISADMVLDQYGIKRIWA